jgi:ribosomal protein S18 acetylase RimI-like enzyme
MDELRIEPAQDGDIENVIQLTLDAFGQVSFESNIESKFGLINDTSWQIRKADHIREDFSDPNGLVLLAKIADETIGFVSIRLNQKSKIGVIANLAVATKARNEGVGRKLIKAAIGEMKSESMELARIETLDQNDIGKSLYPKLGFREIAKQIYYCQDLRTDNLA